MSLPLFHQNFWNLCLYLLSNSKRPLAPQTDAQGKDEGSCSRRCAQIKNIVYIHIHKGTGRAGAACWHQSKSSHP